MAIIAKEDFGKIGVLMGGPSAEREISLKSGKAIFKALLERGINVEAIDITTDSIKENAQLLRSRGIDCAFLALHGCFGEDGQIQGILEGVGIAYTGSGVLASRLAMDKIASRRIFEQKGLNVPRYKVLEKNVPKARFALEEDFSFPLVVKPASNGSSIGLSIVDGEGSFSDAIENAFNFDRKIIIEEYLRGREVTVGILDERPLPVIEVIPKRRFFDFEAKYQSGLTEYVVPAELEFSVARAAQDAAQRAHKLLGCSGCSRVDIILNKDSIPFILEVNTIPGFTATSLLPKAAGAAGIDFGQLCIRLIELAYEKTKTEFSRSPSGEKAQGQF
ncbi:MAG: D-alanine--D-alanine ligase [Candidatus Omnitrophica bacterium]|nr:D-alanine--D-alanine ligase [Candidatus Omnitrophota bacterium]